MQGLAGNLPLPWLTGSSVSQAPPFFPFHQLTTLACPQQRTGRRERAGIMYEVCRLLCAIHVLSQNGIIFATVSEAMLFPISQSETQAHRTELCDLTRARELQDSNPDLTNWKAWFLPHRPLRLLPQGLPGICQHPPPHTLVQNVGCRLYLSPFSTASLALAAPWPTEARVHAQQLLCHVALHQALGPEARLGLPWQCPTPGLPREPHKPLECLRNPTLQASIQTTSPRQPLSLRAAGKSFQIVS